MGLVTAIEHIHKLQREYSIEALVLTLLDTGLGSGLPFEPLTL